VKVLRSNSRLRADLNPAGIEFIEWSLSSIERLLPHVEMSNWRETDYASTKSVWASSKRDEIRMAIALSVGSTQRNLEVTSRVVARR